MTSNSWFFAPGLAGSQASLMVASTDVCVRRPVNGSLRLFVITRLRADSVPK